MRLVFFDGESKTDIPKRIRFETSPIAGREMQGDFNACHAGRESFEWKSPGQHIIEIA